MGRQSSSPPPKPAQLRRLACVQEQRNGTPVGDGILAIVCGERCRTTTSSVGGYCPILKFPLPMECGDSDTTPNATRCRLVSRHSTGRAAMQPGSIRQHVRGGKCPTVNLFRRAARRFGIIRCFRWIGTRGHRSFIDPRRGGKKLIRVCSLVCTFGLAHERLALGGGWSRP